MKNSSDNQRDQTTLNDVKQLGLWASLASLGYVFWIVGGMEMVERLAYYGVRSLASIYTTRPVSEGGLGVTMLQFGTLLTVWSLLQSLIPIFTGGLSDRYGYKQTIFVSTVVKCLGYLIMALIQTYTGFFIGAVFLAIGTAIFKPGIQGTLVRCTSRQNSSMAWGIFYQTVNIGAWIGPLIALQMRQLDWTYVFYTNAAFICINFLLLLTYKEPGREERLARQAEIAAGKKKQSNLFAESLKELSKPHLWVYLLIFCVWWFMFPMLWDVLPKYVDDWVDTSAIVNTIFGDGGTSNKTIQFLLGMSSDGKSIEPEGIVNINAGIIMLTCFIFAGLSAKIRATTSLLIGTICVIGALVIFGFFNLAWCCVGAMVIFSIGEMLASPKYSEFLGNIAPPDKKAMWIGFSQAPIMAGGTLESWAGPRLYYYFSDKEAIARKALENKGMSSTEIEKIPMGEGFSKLVELSGKAPEVVTRSLYEANNIGFVWYFFAFVGVFSAIMIYTYGIWIKKLACDENT